MTLKTPNKATESTVEVDALYKFYRFKIYILVNDSQNIFHQTNKFTSQ